MIELLYAEIYVKYWEWKSSNPDPKYQYSILANNAGKNRGWVWGLPKRDWKSLTAKVIFEQSFFVFDWGKIVL